MHQLDPKRIFVRRFQQDSKQDSSAVEDCGAKDLPVVASYEDLKNYILEAVEKIEPCTKKQKI